MLMGIVNAKVKAYTVSRSDFGTVATDRCGFGHKHFSDHRHDWMGAPDGTPHNVDPPHSKRYVYITR